MFNHILSAFRTYMHGDGAVLLPEMQLFLFAIGTLAMDSWTANTSSEKAGGNSVFQPNYWNPAIALAGIGFSALTLGMLRARIMQSDELAGFHAHDHSRIFLNLSDLAQFDVVGESGHQRRLHARAAQVTGAEPREEEKQRAAQDAGQRAAQQRAAQEAGQRATRKPECHMEGSQRVCN